MARQHVVYPDADEQIAGFIAGARAARLDALGSFALYRGRPADAAEFASRIEGASGLLLGWDLPSEALRAAPRLKVVSFLGTGPAKFIDLREAAERGITVTNTPGYGDNAVAEHALALLLALARGVALGDRTLREGAWDPSRPGMELRGRTLGLVGLGGIGARMAALGRALGMKVQAWTRNPSAARAAAHGVTFVALDDLLASSDVVSLHLALNEKTAGLIDGERFDRMKAGAVFINTARAEIADEAALVECLRTGRVAAAGLDVFIQEPLPADHPLLALDNVVLTPHVGYNTPEASAAMLDIAIDNLVRYFAGRPRNVVARPGAR